MKENLKDIYFNRWKELGKDSEFIGSVEEQIIETTDLGIHMGEYLEIFFSDIGFDTKLIKKRGAISLDVCFGPELVALDRFKPSRFVITEHAGPRTAANLGELHWVKRPIQALVGEHIKHESIDNSTLSALGKLKERKFPKVGLITWINIYPSDIIPDRNIYAEAVINASSQFLVKDGIMLVTAQNVTSIDAEGLFKRLANNPSEEFDISYIDNSERKYGYGLQKHFLLIQKK